MVVLNVIYNKSPLTIFALMFFLMWIIDAIGSVPALYPAYQWYVWGFIGLSLRNSIDSKSQ